MNTLLLETLERHTSPGGRKRRVGTTFYAREDDAQALVANGLARICDVQPKKIEGRDWAGKTVAIVASGPSLTEADCDELSTRQALDGWVIVCVKDTYKRIAAPDVIYGCDPWWFDVEGTIEAIRQKECEVMTLSEEAAIKHGLTHLEGEASEGLSKERIHFGGNSGYQALAIAYMRHASRIVLLGFDMQRTGGQTHYFGNHPYHKEHQGPGEGNFPGWIRHFGIAARQLRDEGVEVINATRETALDCFPRSFLEDIKP